MNYVQQDFSGSSLMAVPANFTSFCLASTYDTLPSPTNLKKWRRTTEDMCILCSKDVCTTAHILGTCKLSLLQGSYTLRRDTILRQVIAALKTFMSNIKEAGLISAKSSSWHFTSCIRLVLLADLNSNYCVTYCLHSTKT